MVKSVQTSWGQDRDAVSVCLFLLLPGCLTWFNHRKTVRHCYMVHTFAVDVRSVGLSKSGIPYGSFELVLLMHTYRYLY
jgi:hypothetical protein